MLQAPIPSFEGVVRGRWQRWAPDFLRADADAVHAHITVLAPFVAEDSLTDDVLARVASVLRCVQPFTVRFTRLDRFTRDGLIHAVPEPASPWRQLTAAIWREFPDHAPYGGTFGDVAPHVSLDHGPDAAALLGDVTLPTEEFVTHLELVRYAPRRSAVLHRFALGA